jgi:ABC-2 type transport system ATP-binding protein
MITINGLTVSYKKGFKVIDFLNLTMNAGAVYGIAGLNGAGKTTLFNAVFGLINKERGEVLLDGQPLTKRDAAYLPAENYFYSFITGREYLNLFDRSDIDRWNSLFRLPLDTIIDEYSTGMKKKLALIAVLRQDKPFVMLDEPFNGLDIEAGEILKLLLLRLKEAGKTILLSSHIIESLTNVCDEIHYLEAGKIRFSRERSRFPEFETELSKIIYLLQNDSGFI